MSPSLYNSFWKGRYTCRKTDCGLNDIKEHLVRYFTVNKSAFKISEACVRQCERTQSV